MSHYEERLEHDLQAIRDEVARLAQEVGQALEASMRALLTGDTDAAHATVLGDHAINRKSRRLDRDCHAFIARHLPSSRHLRMMSSVIRINVALERIGDYAVTISRESLQLSGSPGGSISQQLQTLGSQVAKLLADTVNAFVNDNADAARALMSIPEQLEASMDGVYDKVIDSKKRTAREIVGVFVVFSLLKRVADQAKNIADQTVFAVSGESKSTQSFDILFVDENNRDLGPLAAAVGRKRYGRRARFASAGRDPANQADPAFLEFLASRGLDDGELNFQSTAQVQPRLNSYHIVIGLNRQVSEHFDSLPFHTSALHWEIAEVPETASADQKTAAYEAAYRSLTAQIDQLMNQLLGDADHGAS